MPSPDKRTFSLPTEQSGYIHSLVASGAYASGARWYGRDCGPCKSGMRQCGPVTRIG